MKAGELYRYSPDFGKWCRHGLRRITEGYNGALLACDTYWGSGEYSDPVPVEKIAADLEFVLDLNNAVLTRRDVWERYAEKDRAYIPVGGGGQQFWVSRDADPDPKRVVAWLTEKRDSAQSEFDIAKHTLEWAEKELEQARRNYGITTETATAEQAQP